MLPLTPRQLSTSAVLLRNRIRSIVADRTWHGMIPDGFYADLPDGKWNPGRLDAACLQKFADRFFTAFFAAEIAKVAISQEIAVFQSKKGR